MRKSLQGILSFDRSASLRYRVFQSECQRAGPGGRRSGSWAGGNAPSALAKWGVAGSREVNYPENSEVLRKLWSKSFVQCIRDGNWRLESRLNRQTGMSALPRRAAKARGGGKRLPPLDFGLVLA
jgi:hypothetical protein